MHASGRREWHAYPPASRSRTAFGRAGPIAAYGFEGDKAPAPLPACRRPHYAVILMPDSLFSPATLKRLCADVKITGDQHDAALEWLSLLKDDKLQKEVPNYPIFMSCVLDRLLGYKVEDIKYESDDVEFQFLGPQRRPLGCFEVKGTLTRDLFARQHHRKGEHSTPIKQTWDYMGKIGLEYGVCTNYRHFVLITKKHGYSKYYTFDFESVKDDPKRLQEFVGVFAKASIGSGFVERAHVKSINEDKALTDEFYDLYGRTRLMLIREFEASDVERGSAVAAAQTLLNRLVFIFFAQDSGLVGDADMFTDGVIDVLHGRLGDRSRRVWSYLADELFPGFDKGSHSPRIFGFNGGLFEVPLPREAKIMDLRPGDFFDEFEPKKRRRSWEFKTKVWDAVKRHDNLNPIIKNLLAMSSYDFKSQIRVTILGHIFEKSISEIENLLGIETSPRRKREGVFYTPAYVTRYICRSTIIPWLSKSGRAVDPASLVAEYIDNIADLEKRLRGIRILDPACGSGAFLIGAADTLLDIYREIHSYKGANGGLASGTLESDIADASPLEIVRNNLYGIDINPQSVEITRLSLYLMTASLFERLPDLSQNIVVLNSVKNVPRGGWTAAFPKVFQNSGGFDIIIGNPPYVRQEDLRDKDSMGIPDGSGLALEPGFEIPRKSDLSSYFYYHSIACLAEGGRLGFIASDGWLHHDYGLQLQRVMLDNCRIDALLRPTFNVFDDADIKTVIALLTSARPAADHRMPLASIPSPRALDDWPPHVVAKRLQKTSEPGKWLAHFAGPVPRLRIPTVPMGRAGRLEGGVKTGRNAFFVLTREAVRDYSIRARFRRPVLSDGIADGCLGSQRAREHLLSVDLPKGRLARVDGGAGVLRYIEDAEAAAVVPKKGSSRAKRGIADLESLRGRDPWYSLGLRDDPPAMFLGRFIDRRLKAYRNNGRFYARDNFAGFTPSRPEHADALLAYLASPWFALHLEKNGHVAGGGALQVLIADLAEAPVPDLDRMDGRDVDRLGRAWEAYCCDLDRARLDGEVLDALGFTGPQQERMARQLETLVSYRAGGSGDGRDGGGGGDG